MSVRRPVVDDEVDDLLRFDVAAHPEAGQGKIVLRLRLVGEIGPLSEPRAFENEVSRHPLVEKIIRDAGRKIDRERLAFEALAPFLFRSSLGALIGHILIVKVFDKLGSSIAVIAARNDGDWFRVGRVLAVRCAGNPHQARHVPLTVNRPSTKPRVSAH
jgi:hypothetical protein